MSGRTGARTHGRTETDGRNVRIRLTVNGEERDVVFAGYKTLLEVLREDLGLTGTKHGCELGECGACTVLLDGEPVLSVPAPRRRVRGRERHHRRGPRRRTRALGRSRPRSPTRARPSAATARRGSW